MPYTLDDLVQDIREIIKTEKMPDGSDAMGSATFVFSEETGQPLASRTRIVTRAPKPERAAKKEIKL